MPVMISRGRELIRISPKDNKKLEFSTNGGRSWVMRYGGSTITGAFIDLLDNGRELLATTSIGLFFSTNDGRSWILRKRN